MDGKLESMDTKSEFMPSVEKVGMSPSISFILARQLRARKDPNELEC
jgi:hypothetical protein